MPSFKENIIKYLSLLRNLSGSFLILLMTLTCLIVVILAITIHRPNKLKEPVTLLIRPGYSTVQIAGQLKENNVILSKWLFILYTKTVATNKKLIAGEYEFLPGKSLKDIVNIISKGESLVRRLTIPEGFTTWQIVNLLNNETRLAGTIGQIPDEGTLFPDTYSFKYGDLRTKLLTAMQEKMNKTISNLLPLIPKQGPITNIQQLLTLASIVEKEAGNDMEKPIVASVFINRMKKKMKLQADPTVIYGITMGKNNLGRLLSKKDLETKTAYNTYTNLGLPPTPIACPGLKSLEAVLKPAETNYLYFVVNGMGGHNFSSSLDVHNGHVKNYRDSKKKLKEMPILAPSKLLID